MSKFSMTRIEASAAARHIQTEANAKGRKLSYTQALAELAKRFGFSNVHEMTKSYAHPAKKPDIIHLPDFAIEFLKRPIPELPPARSYPRIPSKESFALVQAITAPDPASTTLLGKVDTPFKLHEFLAWGIETGHLHSTVAAFLKLQPDACDPKQGETPANWVRVSAYLQGLEFHDASPTNDQFHKHLKILAPQAPIDAFLIFRETLKSHQ